MTPLPVTVDLGRLRAVADCVERSARALAAVGLPAPDPAELPGAVVSGITGPAQLAERLAGVVASAQDWAEAARRSAGAFENADHDSATRM